MILYDLNDEAEPQQLERIHSDSNKNRNDAIQIWKIDFPLLDKLRFLKT